LDLPSGSGQDATYFNRFLDSISKIFIALHHESIQSNSKSQGRTDSKIRRKSTLEERGAHPYALISSGFASLATHIPV